MKSRITTFLFATLFFSPLWGMELSAEPELSTTGTVNLRWQGGEQALYELEQRSLTLGTRILYQGSDTARVVTGLPNGEYDYRVRAIQQGSPGTWSEERRVNVRHHSLSRALVFFSLGLLVFLATLIVVLRGARD